MSIQSATAGNAIHPSAQGNGTVTTTTATVGVGANATVGNSTLIFPNGAGGGGSGQVVTTGYMHTNINATKQDIQNLMKYFNSILVGMVLLSNETEDTKQVLTVEEGFTMFAKYQNLGHKVTVTMLSGEAAKVLYGAK